MGLSSLGQSIIKQVAAKKFRIISNINSLTDNFKTSCPPQNELINIINQKNKLLNNLNQLKRNLIKIDKTTKPLLLTIPNINKLSNKLKNNGTPLAIGGVSSPVVSFSLGSILTASDSLSLINQQKLGLLAGLSAFESIKKYVLEAINEIINKIKNLELLIERCSKNPHQNPNIPSKDEINPNSPNISDSINNSNQIFEINNLLNIEDSNLINNLQNSNSNQNNTYNGFKFEILLDNQNNTKFPKRYAIAKNQQGIVVLKGESSFSSSTQVLIDELKFIIDSQNLKAF